MKFKTNALALLSGLKPALNISLEGVVLDWDTASKITLKASDGGLTAVAHGGKLAVELTISDVNIDGMGYKCDEEGEVTVDAGYLQKSLESFRRDDKVIFEADDNEAKISLSNDHEEFQSIPVLPDAVEMPELAKSFSKTIKIKRSVFLYGIKRIFFAVGDREEKEELLYCVIKTEDKKAKFIGGTGARFAQSEITGDFLKVKGDPSIMFHKNQTQVIISLLSESDAEDLTVKFADRTKTTPNQIIFEAGSLKFVMVAFDPNLDYSDVDSIINADYPIQFCTRVEDWLYATKGMNVTYTETFKKQHNIFPATLHVDLKGEMLKLESNTELKSSRKVPISKVMLNKNEDDELDIRCVGPFLSEIPKYCENDDEIEIHMINYKKPVLIRHLAENTKLDDAEENFQTFFALLKPE